MPASWKRFFNLLADALRVKGATTLEGALTVAGKTSLNGPVVLNNAANADGITVLLVDGSGNALLATGTTKPSDTRAGYAKGCFFIDTDVATGTTGLYVNVGATASCVFKTVTNA